MTKRVIILRHAKSDWADEGLADYDRPLNKRGRSDAPRMGEILALANHVPELIISSPALRAKQTAELVAEACEYKKSAIQWEESLYGASSKDIIATLRQLPDDVMRPLIIGHNPTMEETVANLCTVSAGISSWGNVGREDFSLQMTTASMACLDIEIDYWSDLMPGRGILQWFLTPKLAKTIMR